MWNLLICILVTVFTSALCNLKLTEPSLALNEPSHEQAWSPRNGEADDPLILTKYIEENKLKEAREAARVNLDKFYPAGIESYSGYFTVNKEYNANLFFWYFPVAGPVEETPWIIWLQGGPGATSFYGLFLEIGPFTVHADGKVEEMPYSWGKNHSLVFIDNPVGTGYSFTDDDRGYATNQTQIGEALYTFLQQFLTVFPELRKAPLTIAGESYAGKHIPSLGVQILWNKETNPHINLHGLAIGNGLMDAAYLQRLSYFALEAGLIDDNAADKARVNEEMAAKAFNEGDLLTADRYSHLASGIIYYGSALLEFYNILWDKKVLAGFWPAGDFITSKPVREAIHVGSIQFVPDSSKVDVKLGFDRLSSVKPWVEELIQNYPVMCYNGHLDFVVAYHPSVHTYQSLRFPGSELMYNTTRYPWCDGSRLAGYVKTVGNFSDVMVRGAGHLVPLFQPSAALKMISAFTRGQTLTGSKECLAKQ